MTRQALAQGATFIMWPESATPLLFRAGPRRAAQRSAGWPWSEGHAAHRQRSGRADQGRAHATEKPQARYYNAAFLVKPDGTVGAVYRKMHLVPFGEYVPLQSVLFFVGPIVDAVSDFSSVHRRHEPGAAAGRRPPGEHRDLLRGDLSEPDAAVRPRRQRAADDDHQRRLVRPVVGRLPALGAGVDARDRAGPVPGARRQHRHQRLRRSVRPRHGEDRAVRARGRRAGPAVPDRTARSTAGSATSSPGCRSR